MSDDAAINISIGPPLPPEPPAPPKPPTVGLTEEAPLEPGKVRPSLFLETFGTDCSVLHLLHAMDVMPRGLDELVWDLVNGRRGILDLGREEAEAIDSAVPELVSCLGRKRRESAPRAQPVRRVCVRREPPPDQTATSSGNVDFSKAYDWLK